MYEQNLSELEKTFSSKDERREFLARLICSFRTSLDTRKHLLNLPDFSYGVKVEIFLSQEEYGKIEERNYTWKRLERYLTECDCIKFIFEEYGDSIDLYYPPIDYCLLDRDRILESITNSMSEGLRLVDKFHQSNCPIYISDGETHILHLSVQTQTTSKHRQ